MFVWPDGSVSYWNHGKTDAEHKKLREDRKRERQARKKNRRTK